jgi:basic amino acid/polyamine antiporter, APA family
VFWRVKTINQLLASAEKKSLHRSLGALQVTMLGIGAIIGTGIFVLTSAAAQKAGPGLMASFVIAGVVCALIALCYTEMSTMVPFSGSAYTYAYAVLGEYVAWIVGWALILEYTLSASTVAVGWSGYVIGLLNGIGIGFIPAALTKGPVEGGIINLPAALIALSVTALLVIGTRASALFNAVLVILKLVALSAFVVLSLPVMNMTHFEPFAPTGFGGISAAAATIFFAYLGFDAVATAAEETRNPRRNLSTRSSSARPSISSSQQE